MGQCPHTLPKFPISFAYIGTNSMFSEPKSKSSSNVIYLLFPLHQKMSLCTINIIDGTVPSAMAVKEKLIWGISVKSGGSEVTRMLYAVVCSVYSFHIRALAAKGSMVSG